MLSKSFFGHDDESHSSKLSRKVHDDPFMTIGLVGLIGVCCFGIYKYRTRGEMSTSVFLMQLRVAAQGTFVGALTMGLAYTMADKYLFTHNSDTSDNDNNKVTSSSLSSTAGDVSNKIIK